MSTFRIKAEFDVRITDEATAREVVEQHLIHQVDKAILEGGRVETGTKTPAERIEIMLDNPLVVSTTLVNELLIRGASQMAMVECSNLNISHVND